MMGRSISIQNIERDIAMSTRHAKPSSALMAAPTALAPLPPILPTVTVTQKVWPKSIVMSNIEAVSSSLKYELASPLTFTKIAVEQVSVHAIYNGAPGSDSELQISLFDRHSSWNMHVSSRLPYGRFSNEEFAKTLEKNFNSVSRSGILSGFVWQTGQKLVTLHTRDAPDTGNSLVRRYTTFVEATGNQLPMDKLVEAMKDEKNKGVSIIQKIPPGTVTELPFGGFAVSLLSEKDFPTIDRPCISVLKAAFHFLHIGHENTGPGFEPTAFVDCDVGLLPAEQRGDYDYICKLGIGETGISLRVIMAIAECRCVLANYQYSIRVHIITLIDATGTSAMYARVVGVKDSSVMRYPDVCDSLCSLTSFEENIRPDPRTRNSFDIGRVSETAQCVFKVYTGLMLAAEIAKIPQYKRDCPDKDGNAATDGVFKPRAFSVDYSGHDSYLLDITVALAGAYVTKYGIRFRDRVERCRLLTQIQENPGEYGLMCDDVVVIMLVNPFKYSGNPLTRKYRASNTVPGFRLSGKGCSLLGINTNTESVDLGGDIYSDEFTETLGLTGTCGFQFMCGVPVGIVKFEGGVVSPQRLLGYISVNGVRTQGTIHGSRHAIDVPIGKEFGSTIYEPRHRVGVEETQPRIMSSIGIQFENIGGAPISGEYTVVLSIE